MAEDEIKVLQDAKKLPLSERVAHTNWKARSAAYEDISAACAGIWEDSDPRLAEYGSLFVKSVADANAAAQDKALDALNAFLAKATVQHVNRSVDKTCSNIVAKALGGRTGTVQRATEALMSFIELEQSTAVVEALLEGLKNKVAKVVMASVDVLVMAITCFGTKVVLPQPIIKALPEALDSKDGKIRDKAKILVVELSRWVGIEVIRTTIFKQLRDAIKDELDKACEAVSKEGKPKPERFTRAEQARLDALRAKQEASGEQDPGAGGADRAVDDAAVQEEEEAAAPDADPYDFSDPKDILSGLKKEFWEGLAATKWSDRKAALTQLKEAASYPRLASGRDVDYGDLHRELRKVITKDSNVACVAEAIACTGALAQGLRAAFAHAARNYCEVLFEKFKEKNAGVNKAIHDSLTIMHKHCFTLMDVAEYVTAALGHANPKVKEDTLTWLKEVVGQEDKAGLPKLAAALLPSAAKCAEEATPSLREAAMGFMAAFAVKVGNPAVLDKYTTKMDEGKKKRLDEILASVRGVPAAAAAASSAGGAGSRAAPAAAAPAAASRPVTSSRSSVAAAALAASRAPPGRAASARTGVTGGLTSPRPATGAAAKKPAGGAAGAAGGAAGGKDADVADEAALASGTLSKDEALAQMIDMFGEATINQLQDVQWKTRLDAMDGVVSRAQDGSLIPQVSALIQGIAQVPGWDEKNFQVMARQFEVIRVMAGSAPGFGKRETFVAMNGILDKLSDIKLKGPGFEALSVMSEAVGPSFVAALLHKKAAVHKNPKVLSEAHNWLGQSISEFGLSCFNVKALLDWSKEDLQSANAGVRNSVIQMLAVMHRFLGSPLADMIRADVKPALMAAIDVEFSKNPKNADFTPSRTSRVASAAKAGPAAGGEGGGSKAGAGGRGGAGGSSSARGGGGVSPRDMDSDDLLPRSDISSSISHALLTNMGSANWKERKEAMDEVETLITQAGGRIQPQLGELVPALKARLADANKNLVAQALLLIGKLAKAMGRPMDRVARPLLPPALKNISDNKPVVRGAVCEMMSSWAAATGVEELISELADTLVSAKATADGRTDGIEWLAATVSAGGKAADQTYECMRVVAAGSTDKAGTVREATTKLVTALLQVHASSQLAQAASALDQTQRKAALDAVSKVSGAPVATPTTPGPQRTSASGSTGGVRSSTTSLAGASSRPTTAVRSSSARAPAAGVRSSLTLTRSTAAKDTPTDEGPLILPDNKKEDRARKGKFRPSKLEIRPDELATLEGELGPLVAPTLKALLFGKDFKRHCEAADLVRTSLPGTYPELNAVLDLLLRWCTVRIAESNTQSLVKVLDLLREVFAQMEAQGDKLSEYEVKLILPVLVEKSGHNQEKIKSDHKELLRKASLLHPPARVAVFLKDGLESKNNRTRVVCAEELGGLIDAHGPGLYVSPITATKTGVNSSEGLLSSLAKLVSERDNSLRSAALGALEAAYAYEAEGLWKLLGTKLPESAKTLIEERLKYTDKQLAKKGLYPGYKAGEAGASAGALSAQPSAGSVVPPSPRLTSPAGAAKPGLNVSPPVAQPMSRVPLSPGGVRATGIPAAAPLASRAAAGAGGGSILAGLQRGAAQVVGTPTEADRRTGPAGVAGDGQMRTGMSLSASGTGLEAGDPAADAATLAYLRQSSSAFSAHAGELTPGPNMDSLSKGSEAELRRDFRRCLNKLKDPDMDDAVSCLKLLCYELMDNSSLVLPVFVENANELVRTVTVKMEVAFTAAGTAIARQAAFNNRACKYSLNFLMSSFSLHRIAESIEESTLRGLLRVLLLCLLDPRLGGLPEGVAMLKGLNLLMMKILENCNRTHVFCCLISLLLDVHPGTVSLNPSVNMEFAWCDLVVKCLIKMTKMLSTTIHTIDMSALLLSIHTFFDQLGAEEVRRRGAQEDKPVRMVKTVLHELCKLVGRDIYQYTRDLPGADLDSSLRPLILSYIELNLQTLGPSRPAAAAAPAAPDGAAQPQVVTPRQTAGIPAGPGPLPALTAAPAVPAVPGQVVLAPSNDSYTQPVRDEGLHRNTLGSIFNRIAQNPHERQQAIIDLHFFLAANPDTDLDAMMSSASATFKNFILRGLHKVRVMMANQAAQAQQQPQGSPDGEVAVTTNTSSNTSSGGKQQQQQAGGQVSALRLSGISAGGAAAGNPLSPSTSAKNTSRNAPVVGEDKIAELRDRMSRMQIDMSLLPSRTSAAAAGPAQGVSTSLVVSSSDPGAPLAPGAAEKAAAAQLGPAPQPFGSAVAQDGWGSEDDPVPRADALASIQERMERLKQQETQL